MATPEEELNKGKQAAKEFREETQSLIDAFTSLGQIIQDAITDAIDSTQGLDTSTQKVANIYKKDILNGIKKLTSGIDKQIELQIKLNEGEDISKEIAKEKIKQQAVIQSIQARINALNANEVALKKDLEAALNTEIERSNDILKSLEAQNEEREKALGISGRLVKGFDSILGKIDKSGQLSKVLDIKGATKDAKGMGEVFGNIGKNLSTNISKGDMLTAVIGKLVERAGQADKNIANLRRNFAASFNEARKLNDGFAFTALKTGDVTANVESLGEANQNINQQLGIQVRYNDDLLVQANALVKRNKLSAEAAAGFSELTLASGVGAEELVKRQSQVTAAVQNSSKVALNFNQVLEEANKTTGLLRVNLGRTPEGIAKAVAQAKTLGITLNEAAQISGKLLDFQSSIEAELEAEVLTGKQLNLEQARFLALQGKTDEAAAEVLKQVGSLAEFQQMNVLQQQALADATGLTVDQLADQVTKQAAINSQKQDGLNIDAEAQAENASALSVQEKLASAVEKLNSILQITGIIVGGILGAIAFALAPFTGGASLAAFVAGGAALGIGAQAVMDGEAPSSKGPFTITDSYGATAVTAKGDNVVVSPNVNRGGSGGLDNAKMDRMISLLEKIANKNTILQMDGRVLAKTIETSPISSNI
jgi:hypothetical protein